MDDKQLMILVQNGDEFAFRRLFDRYKRPILSYIKNLSLEWEVAEEITHEIFLKVYRKRESFDPQFQFSTWLWTIARNTSLDYLRKKKDILFDDIYHKGEDGSSFIDDIGSDDKEIEATFIEQQDAEVLARCLDKLIANQKEALMLRVYSELDYDQIALAMKISVSSVKSLIHRAKKNLILEIQKISQEVYCE